MLKEIFLGRGVLKGSWGRVHPVGWKRVLSRRGGGVQRGFGRWQLVPSGTQNLVE